MPRALSIVGDSGVGKTTLLMAILKEFTARGRRVAVIKHSKYFEDPDPPAKDSARLRAAGAARVVLASPARTLVFCEHPAGEPPFSERLALAGDAPLILVESYSAAGLPAVELLRDALPRRAPRLAGDSRLRAIVSDFEPTGLHAPLPKFTFDEIKALATFVEQSAQDVPV